MADVKNIEGYNVKDTTARTRLDANNIGTVEHVAGKYHSAGVPTGGYVIPSDGYLHLVNSQYSSDAKVRAVVTGANGVVAGNMVVLAPYDEQTLFVKKGMKVTSYTLISGSSAVLQTYLDFSPIT